MIVVALVVSIVALVVSIAAALAVVELVGQSNSSDDGASGQITRLTLPEDVVGKLGSDFGLPSSQAETSLTLFLSPVCKTCTGIATTLAADWPIDVSVVVTASSPDRMRSWAVDQGLDVDAVVFDDERTIVDGIGIEGSPTVVGLEAGRLAFAVGISDRIALDGVHAQMLERRGFPTEDELINEKGGSL